jgi:hypothetical protein
LPAILGTVPKAGSLKSLISRHGLRGLQSLEWTSMELVVETSSTDHRGSKECGVPPVPAGWARTQPLPESVRLWRGSAGARAPTTIMTDGE